MNANHKAILAFVRAAKEPVSAEHIATHAHVAYSTVKRWVNIMVGTGQLEELEPTEEDRALNRKAKLYAIPSVGDLFQEARFGETNTTRDRKTRKNQEDFDM